MPKSKNPTTDNNLDLEPVVARCHKKPVKTLSQIRESMRRYSKDVRKALARTLSITPCKCKSDGKWGNQLHI